MAAATQERRTDFGPPHYEQFLHPIIKKNYGKWKYHEIVKPGVMVHVSETGDKIFTVRAASPRLMSVDKIRAYCDLADKYCSGYLRFTSRNNVEFLTDVEKNIDPLIADLQALGHPVGGMGNSISNIVHTQGWVHCSDIAILGIHRRPPRIDHSRVPKMCEIPSVSASCPTAAIRPATVDGNSSVEVLEEMCMFCGNCFTVCPAMPLADPLNDGVSIWVGGKVSNARSEPMFSKLAIPFLPNNPPRWPEVVEAIRNLVELWSKNARKYERMGEWIERIGWPKFFKMAGIPFEKEHIDDFKHAGLTYRTSTHLTF
jgi:sulfite reductase beta subunit